MVAAVMFAGFAWVISAARRLWWHRGGRLRELAVVSLFGVAALALDPMVWVWLGVLRVLWWVLSRG